MTYFTHDLFDVCANVVPAMQKWPAFKEPYEIVSRASSLRVISLN